MIKEILMWLVLVILLGFLTTGLNAQVEENRSIGSFSKIHLQGNYTVYLTKGAANSLTVKTKKQESLDDLITEVNGGELKIQYKRDDEKWGNSPKIDVMLTYTSLAHIHMDGKTKFQTENTIESDKLTLEFDGYVSGEMEMQLNELNMESDGFTSLEFTGTAAKKTIIIDGAGKMNALELVAKEAVVDVDGSAAVSVHATENLKAKMDGFSKLKYKGSPAVKDIEKGGVVIVKEVEE